MDVSKSFPFGEMLKTFRTQKRVNQQQLAMKLAVHRNTIGAWERGVYLPGSKAMIMEIARQLQLNGQQTRQLLEASLTATTPYWGVPSRRNPYFTGRDDILQQLYAELSPQHSPVAPKSCALSGLGGIGKTQIALEYAYRSSQEYLAVFWIEGRTYETIMSSFVFIANLLNLPEKQERDERLIVASVKRWLSSHHEWLLIVDNIEDLELANRFLPAAPGGSILLTTNRQALGTVAQSIEVKPMSLDESITFLLRRSKWIGSPNDEDALAPSLYTATKTLAEALDGLPLALDQAGAYIEETQCHPSDYLFCLQSHPIQLLQERGQHVDHPLSVVKTLLLAFEQVRLANCIAADLLIFCSFLAADAIPEQLITTGAHLLGPTLALLAEYSGTFHMALKDLRAYSLLSYHPETRTLLIHRLVQSVLRAQLDKTQQRQWAERAVRVVSHTLPAREEATWRQYQHYIPQLSVCLTLIEEYQFLLPEAAHLLNLAGFHLYKRARYQQAETFYQRALHIYEQSNEAAHSDAATTLNNLALLYYISGRFADAECTFQRSLALRTSVPEPEYHEIGRTLNFLGSLYRLQGRLNEAEDAYLQSLAMYEKETNSDHPLPWPLLKERLAQPEQLAFGLIAYKWGGKLPCSLWLYQQWEAQILNLLALYRDVAESEQFALADLELFLAQICFEQGQYARAEQIYKCVLATKEQVLGPEHPVIADILPLLALIYSEQNQYTIAEQVCKRAIAIKEQALGCEHHEVADMLNQLGKLYYHQGRYDEAKPLYERALALKERGDIYEQASTAFILDNLAHLYQVQNCYEQAEPLYKRALKIREHLFGPQHLFTITTRKQYMGVHSLIVGLADNAEISNQQEG